MKILNASTIPLNQSSNNLPNVSAAMDNWFQAMTFGVITTTITDGLAIETSVDTDFRGVMQPFTEEHLMLKPEGERSWKWFMVHAEPALVLETDMMITYESEQYRVMAKKDYKKYGYIEYHLVLDYQGVSP